MTIDTRNRILSIVFGVIIILLGWYLVRSIVLPYNEVEQRQEMRDHVRARMLNIRDALIRYEQHTDSFPPSDGGLDTLMNFIRTDSLMQQISDSLFQSDEYTVNIDSLIYSPRPPHKKFIYSTIDTLVRDTYVLKDPDSEDQIGSLSNATLINTPSWQ